jgi:type I restriction enzyme, S subunit
MSVECISENIPSGYKQTEVGVIPEDWKIHTIGDSMRLINGRAFKPEEWKEHGLPIIRIQNLNDNETSFNYFSGSIEDRHRIEAGDLLFAWSGTKDTSFGARIWKGPTGVLNQHIFKVIPNQEKLTPSYTLLVLRKVQEMIEKQAHGFKASFVHVKKTDLVSVQLPLPPTKIEQEAIADALSDTDALIESLEKLIAKKRLIKQGVMEELLTGRIRIQGFGEGSGYKITEIGVIPEDWKSVCFADYLNIMSGLGFKKAEYSDIGIRLLRIDNVSYGQITWDSIVYLPLQYAEKFPNLVLSEGDILLALNRPITNNQLKLAVLTTEDSPAILYQRVGKIEVTNDKLDKRFAYFILKKFVRKFVEESSVGSDQPFVSTTALKKIHIPLPPTKEEQIFIATMLSDMDSEITALEEKLSKVRHLKRGMMQELLTGRIRLI